MRLSALVFAAVMLTAAPAFAQTDPAATTTPAATEPSVPSAQTAPTTEPTPEATTEEREPERVCRTIQRTESRLRTRRERICHTQAEWDQMSRDAAELVNRAPRTVPEN